MITDDNNHNSNNLVIDIVMKWLSFGFRQKYEIISHEFAKFNIF